MLQFVLLLCLLALLAGFLAVVCLVSWQQAGSLVEGEMRRAPQWPHTGCPQAAAQSSRPLPPIERNHTLTGTAVIDEQLQQALQYGMRDFVQSWFHVWVSADSAFPDEVQRAAAALVTDLAKRCREADLVTLLSQTVLEESLTHLLKCKEARSSDTEGSLESLVFASLPDDDPWTAVCLQPEAQRAYFQGLTELLLHLMLPEEEFSSPTVRQFLRDVLTQQVWLPLLQTLSSPDYINTTLISLCKESSLSTESFLAAVRTPHSQTEVEALQEFVTMETDRLKARGVSVTDKQRLTSLDVVMTTIENQLDGQPEEVLEEPESSLPLSLTVAIPEYKVQQGRHVVYSLRVQCQHTGVEMVEEWSTLRKFSDFHDLNMTLRTTLGFLPSCLSLPSHRALKKLDPAFLDARRRGLEQYLQTLVSKPVLSCHPQVLPMVTVFLNDEVYRRSSNELNRQVDRIVHPFRKNPVASKLASVVTSASKAVSSPSLLRQQSRVNDSREGTEEEDQDLDLLLGLLDGLFDLRDHGQWLRRQLAHMLSQLLGDRVSRKVVEGVAWLTSPEQVSQYCRDLTNTVWPGGVRPSYQERDAGEEGEGEGDSERVQALRSVLARAKLIGSIPDDLRRLLGTRRTTQGMARLGHLLQLRALNCWLCLRLLEASLETLFPSHSLSHTLRLLRQQLHTART